MTTLNNPEELGGEKLSERASRALRRSNLRGLQDLPDLPPRVAAVRAVRAPRAILPSLIEVLGAPSQARAPKFYLKRGSRKRE